MRPEKMALWNEFLPSQLNLESTMTTMAPTTADTTDNNKGTPTQFFSLYSALTCGLLETDVLYVLYLEVGSALVDSGLKKEF